MAERTEYDTGRSEHDRYGLKVCDGRGCGLSQTVCGSNASNM